MTARLLAMLEMISQGKMMTKLDAKTIIRNTSASAYTIVRCSQALEGEGPRPMGRYLPTVSPTQIYLVLYLPAAILLRFDGKIYILQCMYAPT